MSTQEILEWTVGIDLSARSRGAMRFAKWMHERGRGRLRFCGLHVAKDAARPKDYPGSTGLPLERAARYAQASAQAVDAVDAFTSIEAVVGVAAEVALRGFALGRRADGIIVGRAAPAQGWSLVTLGKVARRLLRDTPAPLMVVPPDLDIGSLGGPIVAAVTPRADCSEAVAFARRLASTLDLPLQFVNIRAATAAAPLVAVDAGMAYAIATATPAELDDGASDALRTWLARHLLGDVPLRVEQGGAVGPAILAVAAEVRASAIVCGSRQLSLTERILASSVGTDLAAHAERPVVVVPPT